MNPTKPVFDKAVVLIEPFWGLMSVWEIRFPNKSPAKFRNTPIHNPAWPESTEPLHLGENYLQLLRGIAAVGRLPVFGNPRIYLQQEGIVEQGQPSATQS